MIQRIRWPGGVSALTAPDGDAGDSDDFGAAVTNTCGGEPRAAGLMVDDRLGRERAAPAPAWSAPQAEPGPPRHGHAVGRAVGREPKVYLVEDDPGICECLRHLCASVGIPVEAYSSAEEFLESEDGARFGCVVTDVCLPGMSGFDLQHALARRGMRLPTIMITGFGDVQAAVRAMKAGAVDFLEKPFSGQLLLDSIAHAFKIDGQARSAEAQRARVYQRFALLTRRERQVMGLVVAGRADKDIAPQFGGCPKTIELYPRQGHTQMGAESLAELVRMAAW